MRRASLIAVVVVVSAAVPEPAGAYRTLADDPALGVSTPPTWSDSTPVVELWTDLPPPTGARTFDALTRAAALWSDVDCSSISFELAPTAAGPPTPGDGRNTVGLITSGWSELGLHPAAGATTDVQLVRADGSAWRISEADLYVDWVGHEWSFDESPPDGTPSLTLALGHELGHVIGLAHPCELDGAPACDATSRESILYPVYSARRAALSRDDIDGICALYPLDRCGPGCPAGSRCESGACVPEECGAGCDAGCAGASCTACVADADCGPDLRCSPSRRTCVIPGGRGAACTSAVDCASELCVAGATTLPICTIACLSDVDCGATERCALADGTQVCAPRAPSTGCAVARSTRGSAIVLGGTFALALAFARRRRRSP